MIRYNLLFLVFWGGFLPRSVHAQDPACGPVPMRAPIPAEERTEVLVLASEHLRRIEDFDRATLEGLLDQLQRWRPDAIGVEVLPPADIAAMETDPDFAPVLEAFAGPVLEAGAVARSALGISVREAARAADSLAAALDALEPPDRAALRASLIPHLAAAHRLDSAALQWSYLVAEGGPVRAVPDSLAALLAARWSWGSESSAIGLALAARLALQEVHPIDDHFDKDAFLEIAGPLQEQLAEAAAYQELVSSGALETTARRLAEAHDRGDLRDFYLEINHPETISAGVGLEWGLFFRTRLAGGLDRARVAHWEERNYGIAANVRRMTARIPGGRALIVIGASHKPFLDAYLSCGMDVTVVQLADLTT